MPPRIALTSPATPPQLLNKIDLVPAEVVKKWLLYLSREFPTLAFKASTQNQRRGIGAPVGSSVGRATRAGAVITGSAAAGAEGLLQLIKNYSRNAGIKQAVTVGIIGYPNVGKSSVINSLKRNKAVGVSPTPGFTKAMQVCSWVHLPHSQRESPPDVRVPCVAARRRSNLTRR